MQKEAAKAGQQSVQARLARYFKTEPNAEDMEPAQVQAVKSKHKPRSLKPNPALEKEVVKTHKFDSRDLLERGKTLAGVKIS